MFFLRVWRLEVRRWHCRAIARGIHPGYRTARPRLEDEVLTSGEQCGYKIGRF